MKLSPIFGWPIAEPDDARRDYPLNVDDPRTLAIEAALAALAPLNARYIVGQTAGANAAAGPASWNGPLITFPVGKFTSTPTVTVTIKNFGAATFAHISSVSAASFQTILRTTESAVSQQVVQHWAAWSMDLSPHAAARAVEDLPEAVYVATCRTPGCHNQDQGVGVPGAALGGGMPDVVCGACGQPVPDVVAA